MFEFICKTNYEKPYIKTATFVTKDNKLITLNRDQTDIFYDAKNKSLCMDWRHVYVCDGDDTRSLTKTILDGLKLKSLEFDDDCPEDYECTCEKCCVEMVFEDDSFIFLEIPILKKYSVSVMRTGKLLIEAEDAESARKLAGNISKKNVTWNGDMTIAVADEDDSFSEELYYYKED